MEKVIGFVVKYNYSYTDGIKKFNREEFSKLYFKTNGAKAFITRMSRYNKYSSGLVYSNFTILQAFIRY